MVIHINEADLFIHLLFYIAAKRVRERKSERERERGFGNDTWGFIN